MNVLIIAAHPDDEVYGMGGTIARLANEGHNCFTLIVTEGCSSQYPNNSAIIRQKKEEAKKANYLLGVKKVFFGDLPDMKLDQTHHIQINKVIEDTIDLIKPDRVYTHFYGDVNKDHQCVFESTLVGVRPIANQCVKELYSYSVPSSTEWSPSIIKYQFMPNVFVEISATKLKKHEAIKVYQSEIRDFPHPRSLKYISNIDITTGLQVGLEESEAFMLLRSVNR